MNDEELLILSAEVKYEVKHKRSKTWSLNQTRILKTRFSIGSEFSMSRRILPTADQLVWYPHPKHAWLLGKSYRRLQPLHHPSHTLGYVTLPLSPTHTHITLTPQPQNAGTPDQSTTVRTFTRDQTRPFDSSHVNASKDDDLASFNELTVAPLLDTLRRRFFRLLPYTYISDIVIAVNPYKAYSHMTTLPDPLIPYERSTSRRKSKAQRHVWATADFAYRAMMRV